MLDTIGRNGSLRFWIAVGMALAILPLGLSAAGGYLVLDRVVIGAFEDVAARQRQQIEPTQRLRLLLWDALVPVDEYLDQGDSRRGTAYREIRQRIEVGFGEVHHRASIAWWTARRGSRPATATTASRSGSLRSSTVSQRSSTV